MLPSMMQMPALSIIGLGRQSPNFPRKSKAFGNQVSTACSGDGPALSGVHRSRCTPSNPMGRGKTPPGAGWAQRAEG